MKAVVLDDLIAIDVPQTERNTPMHAKIACRCHAAIGQLIVTRSSSNRTDLGATGHFVSKRQWIPAGRQRAPVLLREGAVRWQKLLILRFFGRGSVQDCKISHARMPSKEEVVRL